ncbi:MAG: DUF2268 domain-containing putative Zn-dependent protease [Burkholderiaceae bacterium]
MPALFWRSAAAAVLTLSISSTAVAADSTAKLTLDNRDMSPKFLAFYEQASKPSINADARWKLWKELYDYAAVPPGERGDKMARELLDKAWPQYPKVLPRVRKGVAGLQPSNQDILKRIDALLKRDKLLDLTVVNFVGGLEGNAYTYAQEGKVTVVMPIEIDPVQREALATHEFTHAVHIAQGTITGAWERTIAETIISEGLAMHVSHTLMPKLPVEKHVEHVPGWMKQAQAKQREILKAIKPALAKNDEENVLRFTIGPGPNGLEREAYFAGWLVVQHWLKQGKTHAQIARIPIAEHVKEVSAAIDAVLAQKR